jgi:hypothetical protein
MRENRPSNLVVLRAGDGSLHPQWLILPRQQQEFDLWVDYYGGTEPGKYRDTCDWYRESGGTKFPKLYSLIKENLDKVLKYDAVWFPDDDIACDTTIINHLFTLFHQYQLDLAQPSLSPDSKYSFLITINQPEYELRYTSWVEPMVPLFGRDALIKCLDTFNESQSGWGLCWVWPKLLGYPQNKIAIIDGVTVKHTRAVGRGDLYRGLKIQPGEEKRQLMQKYQIPGCEIFNYRSVAKI